MTMTDRDLRLSILDKALAGAKLPEAIEYAHDMWRFISGQDAALAFDETCEGAIELAAADAGDGIVGIALDINGNWHQIDAAGNHVTLAHDYFDKHAVWGRMRDIVTADGHALVEIPHFWVRFEIRGDDHLWWVSPRAAAGFSLHPAFLTPDGRSCAVLRVGKYLASKNEGKLEVAADRAPWTSITIDEARAQCQGLGQGWRLWSVYDQAAVQILALIDLGTPDVQTAIARGNVDVSGMKPTGTTGAVWRGIDDLWGNAWQFVDGLRISKGGVIEVWHDTIPGPDAWVNTGIAYGPGTDDGYPADLHIEGGDSFNLPFLFLPSSVRDAREDAILPDYVWGRWADRETIALSGGDWYDGSYAGVFALNLSYARSYANSLFGFRPAFVF